MTGVYEVKLNGEKSFHPIEKGEGLKVLAKIVLLFQNNSKHSKITQHSKITKGPILWHKVGSTFILADLGFIKMLYDTPRVSTACAGAMPVGAVP